MGCSVIIPSRNETNLRACVSAIRAAGETCRIIVVWDGEMPLWQAFAGVLDTSWGGNAFCQPGVKPFIFSRNVNIGIRAAGNDDVLVASPSTALVL